MSNHSDAHRYIIRQPLRVTTRERTGGIAVLIAAWSVLLWLLAPLFTALFWFIQGEVAWHHMIEQQGWRSLAEVAPWWFLFIFLMTLALFLWAKVNQWRFHGKEKRLRMPDVTGERIAADFGVDPVQREFWLKSRVLVVRFDEQSRVEKVLPKDINEIEGRPPV